MFFEKQCTDSFVLDTVLINEEKESGLTVLYVTGAKGRAIRKRSKVSAGTFGKGLIL